MSFLQGFLVPSIDIHDISDIDIDNISAFFFWYFQNTIHGPSAVPKRFKRNINEELLKAMRTNSDIKAGIDRIFKMYLNANYPRTFTCLVIHAFDIKVGKIAYLRSI